MNYFEKNQHHILLVHQDFGDCVKMSIFSVFFVMVIGPTTIETLPTKNTTTQKASWEVVLRGVIIMYLHLNSMSRRGKVLKTLTMGSKETKPWWLIMNSHYKWNMVHILEIWGFTLRYIHKWWKPRLLTWDGLNVRESLDKTW